MKVGGDWRMIGFQGRTPRFGTFLDGSPTATVTKDTLQSERCAEMLKALSEPIRLRIVDVLRAGPKNVGEIAEAVGIEIVNASHHLGILKHAGIARSRREGRNIVYRLAEGVFDAKSGKQSSEHINLGCCRLEIPRE